MGQPPEAVRFTLRQLPLPAKLVLTAFLIAVGVGYFSALVQLHLQHGSRDGQPMPTADDVVERFAGVKRFDGELPRSKIETLITGSPEGKIESKANMTPAFFASSGGGFEKECKKRGEKVVRAERDGERRAMLAWINAAPDARQEAYQNDKFPLPADFAHPVTEDFFDKAAKTVAIKSLVEERCLKCHGGQKPPQLDSYAKLEPYITCPKLDLTEDGKWLKNSPRQMGVEGLTQSTHAHLLSFAVLFTLTGLVFAFTSYPGWFRALLAPLVLVAQVADVSCWWLARLDGSGPYFAMAIIGTGAVVGLGLAGQIVLSLFNLYGTKGKLVLLLIAAAFAGGFAVLATKAILPALDAEKAAKGSAAARGEPR